MREHVLRELGCSPKGSVAAPADKDASCAALLLVQQQAVELAEVPAARGASVRLLFHVHESVPDQAGRGGKGRSAVSASEGSLAAVGGLVLCQIRGLGKSLGANRAHVRPHALVRFLMLHHAAREREGLPAVRARERPLPQVRAFMALQGQWFVEGPAATRARVRLVVCVHVALMFAKVGGPNEVLATGGAIVGLLPRVSADVFAVVRRPDVGFGAEGAAVRPLPRVQPLVLLQRTLVGVSLPADVTHMRLEAGVRLQVTLEVTQLLEGPGAVGALEGSVLRVYCSTLFHGYQESVDFVIRLI